jgi:Protein of unknown function (DUF1214)
VSVRVPDGLLWCGGIVTQSVTQAVRRCRSAFAARAPGLVVNDDGSVDVHFAPQARPSLEANFIETGDMTTFELMFRFYGQLGVARSTPRPRSAPATSPTKAQSTPW